jgi:hypothetical protein
MSTFDDYASDRDRHDEQREREHILATYPRPAPHALVAQQLIPLMEALPVSAWDEADCHAVITKLAALVKRNPGASPHLVVSLDCAADEIDEQIDALMLEGARE